MSSSCSQCADAPASSCTDVAAARRLQPLPPVKPKRCLTAYNFYFHHERRRLLASLGSHTIEKGHGKIGFSDLAKVISRKWKATTPEERLDYEHLAELDKNRYYASMAQWKLAMKEYTLKYPGKIPTSPSASASGPLRDPGTSDSASGANTPVTKEKIMDQTHSSTFGDCDGGRMSRLELGLPRRVTASSPLSMFFPSEDDGDSNDEGSLLQGGMLLSPPEVQDMFSSPNYQEPSQAFITSANSGPSSSNSSFVSQPCSSSSPFQPCLAFSSVAASNSSSQYLFPVDTDAVTTSFDGVATASNIMIKDDSILHRTHDPFCTTNPLSHMLHLEEQREQSWGSQDEQYVFVPPQPPGFPVPEFVVVENHSYSSDHKGRAPPASEGRQDKQEKDAATSEEVPWPSPILGNVKVSSQPLTMDELYCDLGTHGADTLKHMFLFAPQQ